MLAFERRWKRALLRDPSLVLYLPLYELDGGSFKSADNYGHLCAVTGATWGTTGRSFDGTDDFLAIPDSGSLNITAALTLEAWVKPSALTAVAVIISKSTALRDGWVNYALNQESGNFRSIFKIDGVLKVVDAVGKAVVNTWCHVLVTHDGTDLKIYADGLWQATTNCPGTIGTATDELRLGKMAAEYFYAGLIGEARIYNRALTAAEIQHNYQATKFRYR